MSSVKSPSLSQRVRTAIKANPLLHALLRPCVDAIRHASRGERAKNLERFRRACMEISARASAPFFAKVGANDGITGDPCSDILLRDGKWRGILIEPVPYCFARLAANFPDGSRFALEPVAIGAAEGHTSFYYVDARAKAALPELPFYYDQLGSFNRDHIVKHLGGALEPFIVERAVEVCRLSQVLRRHAVAELHLLHVDVEGYDLEVLKTLDFAAHAPILAYIEHKHLSTQGRAQMVALLEANGYRVHDCGDDFFAVHEARYRKLCGKDA